MQTPLQREEPAAQVQRWRWDGGACRRDSPAAEQHWLPRVQLAPQARQVRRAAARSAATSAASPSSAASSAPTARHRVVAAASARDAPSNRRSSKAFPPVAGALAAG